MKVKVNVSRIKNMCVCTFVVLFYKKNHYYIKKNKHLQNLKKNIHVKKN